MEANAQTSGLEQRIRALEDQFQIYQLITGYGAAVDSATFEFCASAWAQDGMFDRGAPDPAAHSGHFEGAYGKDTIMKEVTSPELSALRNSGIAHIMTLPHVTIEGDKAVATCYTELITREDNGYRTRRITANVWDLERSVQGWTIKRRTIRLLDGSEAARHLMRQSIQRNLPG
jgi:hypothetical protein